MGAYNFEGRILQNPTMARPVTTGITPPKIRTAKSKDNLLKSGGKRKSFNLQADSISDLSSVCILHRLKTDTEAVVLALAIASGRAKSIEDAKLILEAQRGR